MVGRMFIATFAAAGLVSLARADVPASLGEGPATAATRGGERVRASSPYWNGGSASNAADFPAADIRAVAPARATSVAARWTYNQLLVDLSNATRNVLNDLENRQEFRRALADERAAYDAMTESRRKALAPLAGNDSYIAAETLRRNLTEQIKDAHERPKPDAQQIEAMSRLKLSYVADNRKLEQDALERDSEYQSARSRYLNAARVVIEQRQAAAMMISKDDTLRDLRRQVAESRIARLASAAYLDSTVHARDIALNYAAFYRRRAYLQTYGGYANGFYPIDYGSGYGYGVDRY